MFILNVSLGPLVPLLLGVWLENLNIKKNNLYIVSNCTGIDEQCTTM